MSVIVPTIEVEKPVRTVKPWVKIACVAGAVALVAGIAGAIWQMKIADDRNAYNQAVATQNLAGLKQDYPGAVKAFEGYLARSRPRKFDYEANVRIAILYETMKQPKLALERYRIAEKLDRNHGAAVPTGIARTSEKLGDITTAIKYYRLAGDAYHRAGDGIPEAQWMYNHADTLEKGLSNAAK